MDEHIRDCNKKAAIELRDKMKRYRRRKKEGWETRAGLFLMATLVFATFIDSDGIVGTVTLTGAAVFALLAGGCELLASRWS
jgi:hypothetical protein